MKKVLSTKKLDADTIAYARSLNMEIQCVDFIEVSLADFKIPLADTFDSIAFTSANAVKYLFADAETQEFVSGKKVFALYGRTSEELAKHAIKPAGAAGNATDLADVIVKDGTLNSVLHVCGDLRLDVLEKKLKEVGLKYSPLVVYKTVLLNNDKLNEKFDAVMFYSPSGVNSFFYANDVTKEAICCCIGETTASRLKEKRSDANIILPKTTTSQAMIEELTQYFNDNLKSSPLERI